MVHPPHRPACMHIDNGKLSLHILLHVYVYKYAVSTLTLSSTCLLTIREIFPLNRLMMKL